MRELMLCYGVHPFYLEKQESVEKFIEKAMGLLHNKHIFDENLIALVAGNFGVTHGASFLEISEVKNFKEMRAKRNQSGVDADLD
jgi:pyruvate kinase